MRSTVLDLLAVGLLAGFAFCVWPPLVLLALAACALAASRHLVKGPAK